MSLRFFFSCLVLVLALSLPAQSQIAGTTEESAPRRPQMNLNATPEERAAFDEATAIENSGTTSQAISSYKRFIKNNPASPLSAKAQFRIAELYESLGNASRAFDAYQTLIAQYPDTQDFEKAVGRQVVIANEYLAGKKLTFLWMPIVPGTDQIGRAHV